MYMGIKDLVAQETEQATHYETSAEALLEDSREDFETIFGDGATEGSEEDDPKKFKQVMANLDDAQAMIVCKILVAKYPQIYLDTLKASYISNLSIIEGISGSVKIHQDKMSDILGEE